MVEEDEDHLEIEKPQDVQERTSNGNQNHLKMKKSKNDSDENLKRSLNNIDSKIELRDLNEIKSNPDVLNDVGYNIQSFAQSEARTNDKKKSKKQTNTYNLKAQKIYYEDNNN